MVCIQKMWEKSKNNIMAVDSSSPTELLEQAYRPGVTLSNDCFHVLECSGLRVHYIATFLWERCIK